MFSFSEEQGITTSKHAMEVLKGSRSLRKRTPVENGTEDGSLILSAVASRGGSRDESQMQCQRSGKGQNRRLSLEPVIGQFEAAALTGKSRGPQRSDFRISEQYAFPKKKKKKLSMGSPQRHAFLQKRSTR